MMAPRTQPLSLTWTRGVPDVTLRIVAGSQQRVDGAPGTTSIGCVFESVDGSGSIDAALLAQVPAGTQLNLFTTRTKPVQAGDYDITVGYVTSAATPEKKAFPNIQLE
jgi:hypothetical protein